MYLFIIKAHFKAIEKVILLGFFWIEKSLFAVIVIDSFKSEGLKFTIRIQQQRCWTLYSNSFLPRHPFWIRVHSSITVIFSPYCYSTARGAKVDCNKMSEIFIVPTWFTIRRGHYLLSKSLVHLHHHGTAPSKYQELVSRDQVDKSDTFRISDICNDIIK